MSFESFQLAPAIFAAIQKAGYQTPTPIQKQAIPLILQGRDVIGLAQTGTGKTAAFTLPLLHQLLQNTQKGILRTLIIVPTRELAEQIHVSIKPILQSTGLRCITLYGGINIIKQFHGLRRGADIAIACPGRLLDHIRRKSIDLSQIQFLVLDEADQMFDFGFFPAIREILKQLPSERQSLLFSATMPKPIQVLAKEILQKPETIQIGRLEPAITVTQKLYPITEALKTELLIKMLQTYTTESVLIFTRTKHRAKQLAAHLIALGYSASSFQGNLTQSKRQFALTQFRTGKLKYLVATDIAARGIDIAHVSHVINFDMPNSAEAYTHRIGRTGRASRLGTALTLITNKDKPQIRTLERHLKQSIEKCLLPDFNYQASTKNSSDLLTLQEESVGNQKFRPRKKQHGFSSREQSGVDKSRHKKGFKSKFSDHSGHKSFAKKRSNKFKRIKI